jgi:S1-C subfamily serine protease
MMIRAFTAIALCFAATTASLAAGADDSPVAPPERGVPSLAPMLKKITPAVVNIETRGRMPLDPKSPRRAPREVNSVGSGVVYDAQRGLIVTNDHVLEHAADITVTLTDGRMLKAKRVGGDPDFDLAVISVPPERLTAIATNAFFVSRSRQLAALALRNGMPAISGLGFAAAGGLMGYGPGDDQLRQIGVYVGRILKGESPADLPVQQATKIELIINLNTAKALGLTFPLTLLGRADEVIQ